MRLGIASLRGIPKGHHQNKARICAQKRTVGDQRRSRCIGDGGHGPPTTAAVGVRLEGLPGERLDLRWVGSFNPRLLRGRSRQEVGENGAQALAFRRWALEIAQQKARQSFQALFSSLHPNRNRQKRFHHQSLFGRWGSSCLASGCLIIGRGLVPLGGSLRFGFGLPFGFGRLRLAFGLGFGRWSRLGGRLRGALLRRFRRRRFGRGLGSRWWLLSSHWIRQQEQGA